MKKTLYLEIDGDVKTMELASSGGTAVLYKRMFGKDLIKTIMDFDKYNKGSIEATKTAIIEGEGFSFLEFVKELAFIMNLEATKDTNRFSYLNEESYVDFLCSYDDEFFTLKSADIISAWGRNTKTMSQLKNFHGPQ